MSELRSPQFWLAEIDQYDNPTLKDGSHDSREGAEHARVLFRQFGFDKGKRYAIAEVRLSEPTGNLKDAYVYGRCPKCGALGVNRERRPNGNDHCGNGHTYPSADAITAAGSSEDV